MLKQFINFEMSGIVATEPMLEFLGDGKALLKFGLFVNQNGNSDYFNVVAWENVAKYIADRISKGDAIYFDATLRGTFYAADGDKKKHNLSIGVKSVKGYEKKKSEVSENE